MIKKVILNLQDTVAAGGYFRNPDDLDNYLHKSKFLPRLNNEIGSELAEKNRERIKALNGFMMVMFDQDEVVSPRISQIFGDRSGPMESQELYKNDYLGLKYLNEKNRLEIVHINGKHTAYTDEDIYKTFLPFLKK